MKLGENKPSDSVTTEKSSFTEVTSKDTSPVELPRPRPETKGPLWNRLQLLGFIHFLTVDEFVRYSMKPLGRAYQASYIPKHTTLKLQYK